MLATTDIPRIEQSLYVRKVIIDCRPTTEEEMPIVEEYYTEVAVRAFFTTDDELAIVTTLYTQYRNGNVSRSCIGTTFMPWFDPTDYSDEKIKERISKLLIFS